ncbi:50S ribosomal protein L29 [Ornithobacterium rhinotracheale]|uniref:Large ribosomal subunit protein uL29 n=2 Tax=Ornithobacterium rhinotracheale TaxID=28251 RepID=I3ZY89_ORNRL|nr:50S ribosomal protein L29 [Ornithobacterium rhinotracheale]AFL96673.1 ribosomal protein L29 [Ornithobacterium rhinotracheale DSM 15997]AIP99530.1 50S ribosomal protein L29 [Ornithobacterium rhinotracheale ORT-UMN 88]KGB66537.1 50S ribosomal protein L29 [Ornithobacterium rhinotracheale H06-030791]MBN3662543.1 50S ribosomal protein L29 [Ornithobacterium rhinotracheale]MCK0194022.1 50S ribosomal protein L29 [Ornithobacterium rhinotracheale]
MKASDIKELTVEELRDKIAEEKANYDLLKINHGMSPIENPIQLRNLRKTIARLNTELTKKLNESQAK